MEDTYKRAQGKGDILTFVEVFINPKRVNVHENTVKMASYDSFQ